MYELIVFRQNEQLAIRLGEIEYEIAWDRIPPEETTLGSLQEDAVRYGVDLFRMVFSDAQQSLFSNFEPGERILLIAQDPDAASIPWEYLRDQNGRLVASRLDLIRSLPAERRGRTKPLEDHFRIDAIISNPVDELRVLNTEREYKDLQNLIRKLNKVVRLVRVRPPTLLQFEKNLSDKSSTIVHFMGHSGLNSGDCVLDFEDMRGFTYEVTAADFCSLLEDNVFLVILNSCLSAVNSKTGLANFALNLVMHGVPYALGMQYTIEDTAAIEFSKHFYDFLLNGRSIEQALQSSRRALLQSGLPHSDFLAGIPVLYTNQDVPPAPIVVQTGRPQISPDPAKLDRFFDLSILPEAKNFSGRNNEISAALDVLLGSQKYHFVVLHGLGGVGKTALARTIAERVGWHYDDKAFAYSFESFAHLDPGGKTQINQDFSSLFYNRLAQFYAIDTRLPEYQEYEQQQPLALLQAILHKRRQIRSLLILDNVETLLDALANRDPIAMQLSAFIKRLGEGNGDIILTTRIIPPSDWGKQKVITLEGLGLKASAELFLVSLDRTRRPAAAILVHRMALAKRVDGHPLSIQLLAAQFSRHTYPVPEGPGASELSEFLKVLEQELVTTEASIPDSMLDHDRQRTLYACIAYSVNRLSDNQREVLSSVSLYQAPFLPAWAATMYSESDSDNELEKLDELFKLGLLEVLEQPLPDGILRRMSMHALVRWYVRNFMPPIPPEIRERFVIANLVLWNDIHPNINLSDSIHTFAVDALPDYEFILANHGWGILHERDMSGLAYSIGRLYKQIGQYKTAYTLYGQGEDLAKQAHDEGQLAIIQTARADLLALQRHFDDAAGLYDVAIKTKQALGDKRGAAIALAGQGHMFMYQDKYEEAVASFTDALNEVTELGDDDITANIRTGLGGAFRAQRKLDEAVNNLTLAIDTFERNGDKWQGAFTVAHLADCLLLQGKLREAIDYYEQALDFTKEVDDIHLASKLLTQLGSVYLLQDDPDEALEYLEQAQQLWYSEEDPELARVLILIARAYGKKQDNVAALTYVWDAQKIVGLSGSSDLQAATNEVFLTIKEQLGQNEFDKIWLEAIDDPQPEWLQVSTIPIQDTGDKQLIAIIGEYLTSHDWTSARQIVERNPEILLSKDAEQAILQMIALIRKEGFDREADVWSMSLRVLLEARITSVESAFEKISRLYELATPEQESMQALVLNTIAVLTTRKEFHDEWLAEMKRSKAIIEATQNKQFVEFLQAIIDLVEGKEPFVTAHSPYYDGLNRILRGIDEGGADELEAIEAVVHFLQTKNWNEARHMLESRQELLLSSQIEEAFAALMWQARSAGDQTALEQLPIHRKVIRTAREKGIEAAFNQPIREQSLTVQEAALFANRTIAAMTTLPKQRDGWHDQLGDIYQKASDYHDEYVMVFAQAMLAVLNEQPVQFPTDNPYATEVARITNSIAMEKLLTDEMIGAWTKFAQAKTLDELRHVFQAQPALLFSPPIQTLLELQIITASVIGDDSMMKRLQDSKQLFQDVDKLGIEKALQYFVYRSKSLPPMEAQGFVMNTVPALTVKKHRAGELKAVVELYLFQAREEGNADRVLFLEAILALLNNETPILPVDSLYQDAFQRILDGVRSGGPLDPITSAVMEFVKARTLNSARRILEQRKTRLFHPDAQYAFTALIEETTLPDFREALKVRLQLLRDCQEYGIAATFRKAKHNI